MSVRIRRLVPFLALVALAAIALLAPAGARAGEPKRARNVILMISDGMGPQGVVAARWLKGAPLTLDSILVGMCETYAVDGPVTDSASSATAIATGHKTLNGMISMGTDGRPLATILEAAQARGLKTGLVATSRITHATPACFASHVPARAMEDEIAAQLATSGVQVILGGGRNNFVGEADGGRRKDGQNLIRQMQDAGYVAIEDADGLRGLKDNVAAPVVGLFSGSHMDYELDRDAAKQPSLAEMAVTAIALLEHNSPQGFFLMIEGSRIDHAAHGNDPVTYMRDILAYDEAVAAVLEYARRDGETFVASVADHDCGGFSVGANDIYAFRHELAAGVKTSAEQLSRMVRDKSAEELKALLQERTGFEFDDTEIAEIQSAPPPYGIGNRIAQGISERLNAGWTSHGHTGGDVALYAWGPGSERLHGLRDHVLVNRAMVEALGLEGTMVRLDRAAEATFYAERLSEKPD